MTTPPFPAAPGGQTIYLVNDNAPAYGDSGIWILFVGNPAQITDMSGNPISGMRNLAIPTGAVSASQDAEATAVVSSGFPANGAALPKAPFPLQFISGANAGMQVQVSAFDASSGTFTVTQDGTMAAPVWPLNAQAVGDQFVIGAYSQQLSSLGSSFSLPSSLSGNTNNVYGLGAPALASGVLYVSYGQLTYLGAAPGISSAAVPFQTVEVTAGSNGGATTSDLTAIDYFAIPLQIQSFNLLDGSIADTRTFYLSQPSIAKGLQSIGATLSTGGLYLGPGQIASANSGDPAPFPSFAGYLNYLASSSAAAFSVSGSTNFGTPNPTVVYGINVGGNYQSTYGYSCQVSATGTGYTVAMTPVAGQNSFTGAPSYFPAVSDVAGMTVMLPAVTVDNPVGFDAIIYGAVLDANSFSINLNPGAPALTPATLSGPFSVSAAASATSFTASALAVFMTGSLAGLTLNFTSGANLGAQSSITSVSADGVVTCGSGLTAAPAPGDQFEIWFTVQSPAAQNSLSGFAMPLLAAMNFQAPFGITFQSGANATTAVTAVAMDAAGTITLSPALQNLPQMGDQFSIAVAASDVFTQLYTNSTYSWAVADFLAGLNFGFPGSPTTGATSAAWYGGFPQEYPFGLAGNTASDGYYNPWAAQFYNVSDAYGFAFSDRVPPSPLMGTSPATQALLATVLPQTQLDAPLVIASSIEATSMTLSWPSVAGVTYTLSSHPAIAAGGVTIDSKSGTATLTGLNPYTPYWFYVQGTSGGQTSLVLPCLTATAGPLVATTGTAPFGISFTWAAVGGGSLPANLDVYINGTQWVSGSNVAATAAQGTNLYVIDFQDTTQQNASVYQAVLQFEVDITVENKVATGFSIIGTPTVYGSSGQPSVAPAGPYAIDSVANPPSSPLVLGIDFTPSSQKAFAPVVAG